MSLSQYFEILSKRKSIWNLNQDFSQKKAAALAKILELGHPNAIQKLIPFLRDSEPEIQQAVCNVIVRLFEKIHSKQGYYDTLKYCDIRVSDLGYYQRLFSPEKFLTLLAVASFNSNGFLRERAVAELGKSGNGRAIPFILYRLADWVGPVRQCALIEIEKFRQQQFIDALIGNLAIIKWLKQVERTNLTAVFGNLMKFVLVENRQYITNNFKSFSDTVRFIIARHITESANLLERHELNLFMRDRHFLIRNVVISRFAELLPSDIDRLLTDKSAKVRVETLYRLKDRASFFEIVYPFVFDPSPSVRDFARFALKNSMLDFPALYNKNLIEGKHIMASLTGLAETNGKQFAESIVPYLTGTTVKVKGAAFVALQKLDNRQAYQFALRNLDNKQIGIRRLVVHYCAASPTTEILERAREIYKQGNPELRKSMIRIFALVGRWTAVADIMIGTIDEDIAIRQFSADHLQKWKVKATSFFTQPTPAERERSRQVFNVVYKVHEQEHFFEKNPLTEIDFYLR